MLKKFFSSSHAFGMGHHIREFKRKSGVSFLTPDDENKEFKRSAKNVCKNEKDKESIRKAIESNEFISHIITDKRLEAVLRTIYCQEVRANEIIIQQGEIGSQLFISAEGKFEISTKQGLMFSFEDVRVFGELALLYNEKRKASVRALTNAKVWVLDNKTFKEIAQRSDEEERKETIEFLLKVPTLNTASPDNIRFVADLLTTKFYTTESKIVREGEKGNEFYIIKAGSVKVVTKKDGTVARLGKGQYFGELALINEDVRKATVLAEAPGCECLRLNRKNFIKHFGDIKEFQKLPSPSKFENVTINSIYQNIKLEDFRHVQTIGVGGFGRVDLIQHKTDENSIFALKYLKKYKYKMQEQRDHVLNEKNVQMNCNCPFIIRMYKTFKDKHYLYFLMEAQLGGDLWRLMYYKRRKPFIESEAKFYVGCVIEAFQYLHERGIIYRDLKPENLLVAVNGYVKLTDFGFAKIIGNEKTHSMVGTPDYMPPEIVTNRRHDRAVDCWTLGIFIYELITLKTPFKSLSDHDTYYMILKKGIDSCRFPPYISTKGKNIILELCKTTPKDRLGYSKNGMEDVKNHPWFSQFNWSKLNELKMEAPHVPSLSGPLDLSNFSLYKDDSSEIPENMSDWDEEF